MNKFFVVALIVISGIGYFMFAGNTNQSANSDYLRIHIRANSNLFIDQDIKYEIKDEIVKTLYSIVACSNTKAELMQNIEKNKGLLTQVANNCLHKANFAYTAKVSLKQEYFPTRVYNSDLTLESGVYDALIVELGEAKGDNWWCVIYPPLCFMNVNYNGSQSVTFKSRIKEMIEKFFN